MVFDVGPKHRRRYEFLSWFAGTTVSGSEVVAEPDPQIYEVLVGRFDLDPETKLLIDDREVNVVLPPRWGWRVTSIPVRSRFSLASGW